MKLFFLNSIRRLVTYLLFIQHLPLLPFFLFSMALVWAIHKTVGAHRLVVRFIRTWLWIYFAYNGVWVSVDRSIKRLANDIILVPRSSSVDSLILFMALGYQKIMVVPDTYFETDNRIVYRECPIFIFLDMMVAAFARDQTHFLTHIMGCIPEEPFTIFNFEEKTFRVEPYIDQGFNLVQIVRGYRKESKIPFGLMMAIKRKSPVSLIKIRGASRFVFATPLTPIRIRVELQNQIPYDREMKAFIDQFQADFLELNPSGKTD